MRILFIHPNFPAQFRYPAALLGEDPKNEVVFATGNPRPEWEIKGVKKALFKADAGRIAAKGLVRPFLGSEVLGESVLRLCIKLKSEGFVPDIVYGHSGWGSTWFVRDVFPDARFMCYFEWFYKPDGADANFGRNKPVSISHRAGLRIKNATILNDLTACDMGLSPTKWQKAQFPELFQHKIALLHDGIDTDYFKPEPEAGLVLPNLDLSGVKKIVTYAARGMEPYRGFPQFIESLPYVLEEDKECHIVIAGSDRICYEDEVLSGKSYKDEMLAKVPLDLSRVHFAGALPYAEYIKILQASSVHVYLTRPFVLSWSVLEAMSCGCVVVGSDTEPVREIIEDGRNGFLADFFSPRDIAKKVLGVLSYPSFTKEIKSKARETVLKRFALHHTIPKHMDLLSSLLK